MSPPISYFDVLGIPRAMRIDLEALERAYREASRQTHPDRFGKAEAVRRRLALQQMTEVNDAYRTLKDPQKRAEHLLALEGIVVGKEESRTMDLEFLDEMLELQEKIDSERSQATLDAMKKRAETKQKVIMESLVRYFDEQSGSREKAARALEELRYVRRVIDRADARLEELS